MENQVEEEVNPDEDDDDDSIESIVKRDQTEWKRKAESVKFQGKTKKDLYKEARLIDREYQKEVVNHNWAKAFYFLHLYINISLQHSLHRGDAKDKNVVTVLENLKKVENRLNIAKKGMLYQYKYARELEAKQLEEKRRLEQKKQQQQTAAANLAATAITGGAANMSLEQMNAAMDALRMPGQGSSFSSIPQAVLATHPPVVGKVIGEPTEDVPPPPYKPSSKFGGMTGQCTVPQSTVTHLTLKQVIGDGSCAFRSIAQGMHHGKLSPEQEKRKADELRQLAVKLLRQRGSEEMVGTGMTIEQVVLMKDSYGSYDMYCNAMARSEYAGETEFWLLAEELQIRIAIFMESDEEEGGLEHMITYGAAPVPPICLFWQRGSMSEAGNHYDCLLAEK